MKVDNKEYNPLNELVRGIKIIMKKLESKLSVLITLISVGFGLFLAGIILTDNSQRYPLCGAAIILLIIAAFHYKRMQKQIEAEEIIEKETEQTRFEELISTIKDMKDEIKTEIRDNKENKGTKSKGKKG